MKHSFLRKKAKRTVSLLAAASVAAGQLASASMTVTAIDTAPNADITPQKTLWWGDETPAAESTEETAVFYGDVNGDGKRNAIDATMIIAYAANGEENDIDLTAADVDLDGKVTLHDSELILYAYMLAETGQTESILPYEGPFEWRTYPDPANYEIFNDGMTWQEAEDFCEKRGGHLVTINSDEEQLQIQALIREKADIKNNYWIGLKRLDDTQFGWVTGEKLDYTNWDKEYNNPNNLDGQQNAVLLYGVRNDIPVGKWDDIKSDGTYENYSFYGTENFGFICEYDNNIVSERQEWTDATSLPTSGVYKLMCDVDTSSISVSDFLDLDLNGHTVNMSNIYIDGRMNIRDSSAEQTGTINEKTSSNLFTVYGTLSIYGGTFNGNDTGNDLATIGINGSGNFNLYGGLVTAYYSNPLALRNSGGVTNLVGGTLKNLSKHTTDDHTVAATIWLNYSYTGTLNITGSEVLCDIDSAIYAQSSSGTINISGGKLIGDGEYGINCTGKTAVNLQNNISIKGKKGGIHLPEGHKLNITGTITSADTSIYAEASGVITDGLSKFGQASLVSGYLSKLGVNGTVTLNEDNELYFTVTDAAETTTTATSTTTTTTTTSTTNATSTTSATSSESTTSTTSTSTTSSTTTTTATTTATTTTTLGPLPDKNHYKVFADAMTWEEAEEYCRSVNGHLATLTSLEEQAQITNLLTEAGLGECWLGGKRDENGEFGWITGEPMVYTNWENGEPNNLGGHEDYIHTYSSGQWNDLPGGNRKYFICEWENVSERPADIDEKPTRLDIKGELKVTPMTKQEVIDAGIDISGDDNFNSFKYSIEADFDAAGVVIDRVVAYNNNGSSSREHVVITVGGGEGVVLTTGRPTYVPGLGAYVVRTETVEEEMYMIIYGKSKWLKEFYDVQLIVVNNDTQTLTNCSATLNYPEGLTLVKGDLKQDFGDLKPNEVKTADWYIRGDKEGDYDLTADFAGKNRGEEFKYTFESKDSLHVYSSSALKMTVELPRYSYYKEMYPVKIKLENVSDKPIYDLENVITRIEQGSDATLYRAYRNNNFQPVATKHMDLMDKRNAARIEVDELAPGESAVIKLNIKDLWKSVYEQYIGTEERNAHYYRTLLAASHRPELLGDYIFNCFYERALSEMPVEHILNNVSVSFAGSDMTVPYEIKIIDNGTPSMGGIHVVGTNAAFRSLSSAFYNDRFDSRATYTSFRQNYVLTCCLASTSSSSGSYSAYRQNVIHELTLGSPTLMTYPVSLIAIIPPSPDVTATVYVEEPDGTRRQPAPSEEGNVSDTASSKVFEISEINGIAPDADGKITVTGETVIMLTSNETGKKGILHVDYSDGTKEEKQIISVAEHECSSTGKFTLVVPPKGGESGVAVKVCDICGDIVDSISINPNAVAMLSNKKTYADIRVAVEDAVKEGQKTELSLFGNVNVTSDITIPDYISVLIAPETVITVKDGCKLIAKGEVKDFSGYDYDLSGNGPITAAAITTTTATNTTTTTTTNAATTSDKTSYEANEMSAADQLLVKEAITDLQNKTGKMVGVTSIKTTEDGKREIILMDNEDNVLDTYIIDPETGKGTNAAGEAVELPQTGNNSMSNILIAFGAAMMIVFGLAAIAKSEVLAPRKKNEK